MSKRVLTATQVAALSEQTVHWIAPSLYLQVRPQGTRSWLFRYSRGGENQWMGLGSLADKPLTEARDEAAMLRVLVKRGGDPMGEKRQVQSQRASELKAETYPRAKPRECRTNCPQVCHIRANALGQVKTIAYANGVTTTYSPTAVMPRGPGSARW